MGIHQQNNIGNIFEKYQDISNEASLEELKNNVPLISKILAIPTKTEYKDAKEKTNKPNKPTKDKNIAELNSGEPAALMIASGVYCYQTSEAGLQCFCHLSSCNVYPTNSTSCEDIDECRDNLVHGCSHTCVNTIGSYYCNCPGNLRLANDRQTCNDYNECVDEPCGRGLTCINTHGSYICIDPSVVSSYEAALLEGEGEPNAPRKQVGNIMTTASVSTSSTTLILACTVGSLGGAVFVLSMYMIVMQVQKRKRSATPY